MRDIESKLAGLVEGAFGRLFRSEVSPAELARGLAREMDGSRRRSLDRTWAPHRYDVYLSPADHRRLRDVGPRLVEELSNSLLLHARESHYALAHPPRIALHEAPELGAGRYGVRADFEDGAPGDPDRSSREAVPERTHHVAPPAREAEPARPVPRAPERAEPVPRPRAATPYTGPIVLVLDGRRVPIAPTGGTLGRSRECDVVIASAEVSRRHAELWPTAEGWMIDDLGSTNGVRVGGVDTKGPTPVGPGDRIELGTLVLRVEAA
ncbi:MAG: DUF3662 and FHA domain-containing protein [Solirubrobacteraceae bacterium]|nr:DUF3662 and FHA domain-containing protein [Solirubrobacteraceae bacterium]